MVLVGSWKRMEQKPVLVACLANGAVSWGKPTPALALVVRRVSITINQARAAMSVLDATVAGGHQRLPQPTSRLVSLVFEAST